VRKIFLLFILTLLTYCNSYAGVTFSPGNIIVSGSAGGAAPSYIFEETFNGGSADNTWTEVISGTWTENYSIAPAPLLGAASVYAGSGARRRASFTGTDSKIFATCMIHLPSGNNGTTTNGPLLLADSSNTTLGYLRLLWDTDHYEHRMYYNGGASNTSTVDINLQPDTDYVFLIEYDNGSGADGYFRTGYSTLPFSSWTYVAEIVNTSDTAQAERINLGGVPASNVIIFDEARIDDEAISY